MKWKYILPLIYIVITAILFILSLTTLGECTGELWCFSIRHIIPLSIGFPFILPLLIGYDLAFKIAFPVSWFISLIIYSFFGLFIDKLILKRKSKFSQSGQSPTDKF